MQRFITVFLIICTSGVIASCNTMEGAGQDIQKAGEKLEHSASENK
ncbi:MAG: entericidin A/B family lipoprotein [Pseudomonadota bacterium]